MLRFLVSTKMWSIAAASKDVTVVDQVERSTSDLEPCELRWSISDEYIRYSYLRYESSKCYIKGNGVFMSIPLVYLPSNPASTDKVAKLTPEMFERRLKDMTEAIESLRVLDGSIKHPSKAK